MRALGHTASVFVVEVAIGFSWTGGDASHGLIVAKGGWRRWTYRFAGSLFVIGKKPRRTSFLAVHSYRVCIEKW